MKKTTNYFFLFLIGFSIYTFFFRGTAEADPHQSYKSYLEGQAIFIDVREEDEVKDGMIKGALWFPLSKFMTNKNDDINNIKKLASNKQIFIYCRSGNRSGRMQKYLEEAGIKSINMGGYQDLIAKNLPTQSKN